MALNAGKIDIAKNVPNPELPFFPTYSWEITDADYYVFTTETALYPFMWVQAFFDAAQLTVIPTLVFSSGQRDPESNVLICSQVCFPFSGALMPFKGQYFIETGVDRRGDTITSTPINPAAPTTSLNKVVLYGGNYAVSPG